jgi:hypothetical protein
MKMEQTECSETLAYKIQTPGNYPEENIQITHVTFAKEGWMGPSACLDTPGGENYISRESNRKYLYV